MNRRDNAHSSSTSKNFSHHTLLDNTDFYLQVASNLSEDATKLQPHSMDKAALDLYAFLQQGRSNLASFVDEPARTTDRLIFGSRSTPDIVENTTSWTSESDVATSTLNAFTTVINMASISSSTSRSSTTPVTKVSLMAAEESNSPLSGIKQGKLKRPSTAFTSITRDRSKLTTSSTTSTEASRIAVELATQKTHSLSGNPTSGSTYITPVPKPQAVFEKSAYTESTESNAVIRKRYGGGLARPLHSTRRTTMTNLTETVHMTGTAFGETMTAAKSFSRSRQYAGTKKLSSIRRTRNSRTRASKVVAISTDKGTKSILNQ